MSKSQIKRIEAQKSKSQFCTWHEDGDGGPWATTCGKYFSFTDGDPQDNGAKFCIYCGKPLLAVADKGEWHKP